MEQLLVAYVESTEHIVRRLARFHVEFEGDSPFHWMETEEPDDRW